MNIPVKSQHSTTLTRTLLAWLAIPLFSLLFLSAYASYRNAAHLAEVERDLALEEITDDLTDTLHALLQKEGSIPENSPDIAIILNDSHDQRYFAFYDDQGNLIAGDSRLRIPHSTHTDGEHAQFSYISLDNVPMRLALLNSSDGKLPGHHVLVAETLGRRAKLAIHFGRAALLPQAIILLLAFPLIWFGVRKGLRPLEQVRDKISNLSAKKLDTIPIKDAPLELQPVVSALNGLLSRLKSAQEEQRRFTADAAHQIKTPLSVLSAEIELALADHTCPCAQPTYQRLSHAVSRLTHLVRQLLALSRSESLEGQVNTLFDLSGLCREVTADYVADASARRIDLGAEVPEQAIPIRGNPVLIKEAIKNLLENALKFTPIGGTITISLQTTPCVLSVDDSGPGVPESEWSLIFQRFHRAPESSAIEGSGLGLAIVHEVARLHHATASVGKSALGGAHFELRFRD